MSKSISKPVISASQVGLLIAANRIAMMVVFLPVVTQISGGAKDAWIASAISGLCSFFIVWLNVYLAQRHPGLTLVGICRKLLGPWAGSGLALIFLWFFFHISILLMRDFAEVLSNALMPETPLPVFIFYVTLAAIFCVHRGLEGIVRANNITMPISVITLVFILLLVSKEIHLDGLLPLLDDGWLPVLKRTVIPIAWSGEAVLVSMLYPYVHDKDKVMRYAMLANLGAMVLLILLSAAVIGVFGANEAPNLSLAVFSLTRMISIARFLERIEAVMVAAWISLLLTKISIYLYAGVTGVGEWMKLKTYRFLITPMAALAMILAVASFDSLADVLYSTSPHNFGIYAITIEAALPALLVALSILRQRKHPL
ncbi:GerAB/ArcD/ProY family transporter [Paenibacillus tyrfis]|uniref:GerAB/ArcD/ProY family transporter n=1 Tax=Paenibacillus tyrfis TaxID=1501230 RepID=UPI00209DDB6D|nr:endospore germination permease [Paenibacillus tyrfis]MCP1310890.1 spore germination protein [Paenibacillus tyrfis]